MRIHHLNCVSGCPIGGLLMDGVSKGSLRGRLATHCLLLETAHSLVLIDTGYGLRDVHDPRSRLAKPFLAMLRPDLREEMTAIRQIERLGFNPRDVREILLSHLDFDHAGGLDDFPEARVHLMADEILFARARRTPIDRMRYRPQQWGTEAHWHGHLAGYGEPWFGFASVRALHGLRDDVLMLPLTGHTLGHAGIAVRGPDRWLLYAADAYFFHAELDADKPRCTPGLAAYQALMEKDRSARLLNQRRLRELKRDHGAEIDIFCAHDVREFERLSGRTLQEPAPATHVPAPRTNHPSTTAPESS
ncbi:MAG TPA: MBL fold metallo-hydrolase [Polyangiales bacterium]|nr:MBL fold metallo-hydrolase [Polyangiales bacterium]